jgi:large subunit ribosomal protein L23
MRGLYQIIKRPIVTEKGVARKEAERTLCFEVARDANKTQIRNAVQTLFKVQVEAVRTAGTAGKLRRRGRFSGYRPDWKKAYVRLKAGQKMPEYTEIL